MELWYAISTGCLALVYISGIFCCIITIVGRRRTLMYKNSLGYIIMYKSAASAMLLTILLFWTIPCCIWHFDIKNMVFNARVGYAIMFFNTPIYMSNVVISANRLITVANPSKSYLLSKGPIIRVLSVVSVISLFYSSLFLIEGCSIYFNSERLLFVYSNTKCGELLALYGDFAAGVTMFSVCLLMDITSICYLRHMRNRVLNTLSTAKRKQRFRMEVVLTVQTFVNTSLYYVMIFSYHFGSELFNVHPMITFLSTNFLWCLVIASGGYTAVLICDELRDVILHPSHLYKGRKNSRQIVGSRAHCPSEFLRY